MGVNQSWQSQAEMVCGMLIRGSDDLHFEKTCALIEATDEFNGETLSGICSTELQHDIEFTHLARNYASRTTLLDYGIYLFFLIFEA